MDLVDIYAFARWISRLVSSYIISETESSGNDSSQRYLPSRSLRARASYAASAYFRSSKYNLN